MKIDLCSDLHLEFADLSLPGGDILVIAGDVMEAKNLKRDQYNPDAVTFDFENKDQRFDRFYRFIEEECSRKYRQTVMVMGNHEHYHFQFEKTADHIRSQLPDNVCLLEKQSLELNGVLFLGATLWTDCNGGDPQTMAYLSGSMNDYRMIKCVTNGNYHKLTPQRTLAEHIQTKQYFETVLAENRARANPLPVVVVTHHAPSKLSIKPRYHHDQHMNGGYSSDLTAFIENNPEIVSWHHGHTHDQFRYQVGSTWVICNPRGYAGYEYVADVFQVASYTVDVDNKTIGGFENWGENE